MTARTVHADIVVCGGGLSGFCAAIAAARSGRKTVLLHDRPVLGGNSSSEVRVTPHGSAAFHYYARETGIISEALIEERRRNHEVIFENGWTNSVWDLTLYDMAQRCPNLELWLNTSCRSVRMSDDGRTIDAVIAYVNNAEIELTVEARIVVDATGDGLIAAAAGCGFRYGSESRDEFGELHAPEVGSRDDVMGNSVHFKTKETGADAPFTAPDWAVHHENADFFYKQGRKPKDERGGFWWIEMAKPYDPIDDAETIRHELTAHVLGIWDWMKNRDPVMMEKTRTRALDWIGQVPGKRESRRVEGLYLMTENDIQQRIAFDDEIAFGGWFLDLHTPGGLLAEHSEANTKENYSPYTERAVANYVGPYSIPLRSCIARDVDNLMLAGRDMSLSHAAFGSVRVMETLALVGQGVGTAAAVAIERGIPIHDVPTQAADAVKQRLLRDGCFLLHTRNEDPADLARSATVDASSSAPVYGAGPESRGAHDGLSIWWDQHNPIITERLDATRGQLIAVGADTIDAIELLLTNDSKASERVRVVIRPVEHIWDYRLDSATPLYDTEITVDPCERRWHRVEPRIDTSTIARGSYLRVDLYRNPAVLWHVAGRVEPGLVSMFEIASGRMRTYKQGVTMSFRVEPAQHPYPAANATNGWSRPYRGTNLWRSDPALPFDQWLRLSWKTPTRIGSVELTFAGNLLREYHAYAPFYHDPQTVRDYSIQARADGVWREVVRIRDNYQRHREHRLSDAVTTTELRVVVHATNGDASAAIYEIRCYDPDGSVNRGEMR